MAGKYEGVQSRLSGSLAIVVGSLLSYGIQVQSSAIYYEGRQSIALVHIYTLFKRDPRNRIEAELLIQ